MRKPIEWTNNSLAANDTTAWIPVPPQCKRASIAIGWTAAADAPTGTFAIVVCNHGKPGVVGVAYTPAPTVNPAGAAGAALFDNIVTSGGYIGMTYTRSGGGTGCVFTDETEVVGTKPTIEFKE